MREFPLVAEALGRKYRRDQPWAILDLSTAVPMGSIVALVGPNGSGKSTLIRSCLGFEVPDRGRVLVFGIDPQRRRKAAVEMIGYVPQAPSLYRSLTIDDHLTFAESARATFDRAFAVSWIDEAGLSRSRRIGDLSGGEQAQVALALALATRAPLLLLDEPLASLDPLARRSFLARMVADVRARGASAIVSSHIVTDVATVCDRVIVLARGRAALDSSIADAIRGFSVVAESQYAGDQTVGGPFLGPTGETRVLIRAAGVGQTPTLEDVILGHMARRLPTEDGAADAS